MKKNVSIEEARQLLTDAAVAVEEKEIVALEAALGRTVFARVNAPNQLPLFHKSPLDGYAVRAEDTQSASEAQPAELEVIEEYHAGHVPRRTVGKGQASKLMTGAPMPEGADAVIKYEDVQRVGSWVQLFYPLKKNSNVIFAGEDIRKGDCMVEPGEIVTPASIGALAAVGVAQVPVRRKIRAAFLSTGDELIEPSQTLTAGKIFNSNLHSLNAASRALGVEVILSGTVADDKEQINAALETALARADIVITTGGVSVGEYDFIPVCLEAVGAKVLFQGVRLKPGSPALAARRGSKILLGLSGNAAAASITFQLLAVPLLKKMMGRKEWIFPETQAVLMDDFLKGSPQRRLLRGHFVIKPEKNEIHLTGSQTNGAVKSFIGCNALVDIPAESGPLCKGQTVKVILTGEF